MRTHHYIEHPSAKSLKLAWDLSRLTEKIKRHFWKSPSYAPLSPSTKLTRRYIRQSSSPRPPSPQYKVEQPRGTHRWLLLNFVSGGGGAREGRGFSKASLNFFRQQYPCTLLHRSMNDSNAWPKFELYVCISQEVLHTRSIHMHIHTYNKSGCTESCVQGHGIDLRTNEIV